MSRGRLLLVAVAIATVAIACSKVPITGRKQFNVIPEKIMIGLGKQTYASTLHGADLERKGDDVKVVERVGGRISTVANRPDYDWTYTLIQDKQVNAWCLPGGYIGVYTGILPVLQNEAGMAFVMGHEVGHAVARHGSERLSQQLALFGGLGGLYLILDAKTEMTAEQRAVVVAALGVGAEVGVLLPFSRTHESEADVIGMMYAASAGYPPAEGIQLWDRMSAMAGKSALPAFLSTHPSNESRQENMRDWLPQARKRYERHKLPDNTQAPLW
jgi:predicted Zn-dependent protease